MTLFYNSKLIDKNKIYSLQDHIKSNFRFSELKIKNDTLI